LPANLSARAMQTLAAAAAALLVAGSAEAGPPFLTDDPEPTEAGHWEIYGPLVQAEGQGPEWSGSAGVELNYGAARNVQLTLDLPVAFARAGGTTSVGAGDVAASVKLRVVNRTASHFQLAVFPGLTLPTARSGLGAGRVTALLPVWGQQDIGAWSVFGGGGYAINPGPGNRDFWTGGLAVSRSLGDRLLLGVEARRQGGDTVGDSATTSLGLGAIVTLGGPFRLLASGGPTFADRGGPAAWHSYLALGWDY